MAEARQSKSEEQIKDLPKKDKPLTSDELGDVAGGATPPIAGVGGGVIGRKPGETSLPNFEASTDGKPPTTNG